MKVYVNCDETKEAQTNGYRNEISILTASKFLARLWGGGDL